MGAERINRVARLLLLAVVAGGIALWLFTGGRTPATRVLSEGVTTTGAPATTAAPTTTTPPETTTTIATSPTTTTEAAPDETPADSAALAETAVRELTDAGLTGLRVTVEPDGVAEVSGVVPVAALGNEGFFAYENGVRAIVAGVEGVGEVRTRLQLRGDEATLRRQLRDLLQATPVIFNPAESALTAESRAVLDQAAAIILASPGLRVLVAGHADSIGSNATNEALSNARALAAVTYLVEQGVPANRLNIVAYGELFPTGDNADEAERALNRRIDFEVAA
jgi:outer membrane protein OmpA-like peptidoglycan-associated protein